MFEGMPSLTPTTPPAACRPWRDALVVVSITSALYGAQALTHPAQAQAADWQLVGRQGLLQVVIVPAGQETDGAAYRAQITRLCPPERTCFVNFYANPDGAVAALPLPDAIAHAATARFRRSMKNGADLFQWSCQLGVDGEACF